MPSWPRYRSCAPRRMIEIRRRRVRAPDRARTTDVMFGTPELPVAAVHSVRGALHRWVDRRWSWLRPRAVPAFVALLALIGLVAVTKHLPDLAAPSDSIAATAR